MPSQLSFSDLRVRRGPLLAVLPDAARVEERLAQAVRAQGFVAGRPACSLAELERDLVREARRAGKCPLPASPHAVRLALREAAREHSHGPFVRIREQPGYAAALGDLLAALTQGLLEPRELMKLDVPERVSALARTLSAAQARLDRNGLVEPHRALRLAVDALDDGLPLPRILSEAGELRFEGIVDWTPLRIRLAAALAARMRVRVRLPWAAGRPELTEAIEPVLRAFEKLGDGPELELFDPAQGHEGAALGRGHHAPRMGPFLQRLFAPAGEPCPAPVELVSCASPGAQAREIARRCAALLAAGAAPESIAVTARTLGGGMAEEISAALDRVGIPWRDRRGRPALPAAPVRLALGLYDLIERDFPREGLIDLLSSRLLSMREDEDRLPPQAVARCLREAHALDDETDGGIEARLDALAARLRRKQKPDERVQETLRRVQRALAALRSLPERGTIAEHASALLSLLARWGLEKRLRTPGPEQAGPWLERAAGAATARDQAAFGTLEDVCRGLSRAAAQLGIGERIARRDFSQLLERTLADASLPPGGARGGAIQLMELRELPERTFDHLLVAGLVDGQLPAAPAVDPLLSDEERRAVNRAARRPVFRVPDAPEAGVLPPRQAEEPLLFQLALASAQQSIVLLWPRADAQGRELLLSPFAQEAARALGQQIGPGAPIASIPHAHDCAGPGELLARAALDAFAEPAFRVSPPAPPSEARALLAAVAGSALGPRLRRIARAAMAERERVRAFIREVQPGRFSGQLSGAALAASAALFRFGPDRPASANQLEEHATCGFRTVAHRVLKVDDDRQDDSELDIRERGKLLHRVLERFFGRLRDEKRLPLRGDEVPLLREIAAAEIAAFALEEHVGNSALWELKRETLIDELIAVVEAESGADPLQLEQKFGFDEPGSWPALRIGAEGEPDVYVRGAVDRVDRTPGGGLLVIDYKSSRYEKLQRKLKPETLLMPEFQLAIYAALLKQREPQAAVDAAYVSLKHARRTVTLGSKVDAGALLELDPARRALLRAAGKPNLADAVVERARQMRAGAFEVRPLDCAFCDLKPACRLVALPTDPDENGGEVTRA